MKFNCQKIIISCIYMLSFYDIVVWKIYSIIYNIYMEKNDYKERKKYYFSTKLQNLDSNKHLLDKIIFSQTTNNVVHGKLIFRMSSWFSFEIAIYFFPKRRKGSTYAYFNFNSNICCHLNALMC